MAELNNEITYLHGFFSLSLLWQGRNGTCWPLSSWPVWTFWSWTSFAFLNVIKSCGRSFKSTRWEWCLGVVTEVLSGCEEGVHGVIEIWCWWRQSGVFKHQVPAFFYSPFSQWCGMSWLVFAFISSRRIVATLLIIRFKLRHLGKVSWTWSSSKGWVITIILVIWIWRRWTIFSSMAPLAGGVCGVISFRLPEDLEQKYGKNPLYLCLNNWTLRARKDFSGGGCVRGEDPSSHAPWQWASKTKGQTLQWWDSWHGHQIQPF